MFSDVPFGSRILQLGRICRTTDTFGNVQGWVSQLRFHLLLTEMTKNVTTPNCCRTITWIEKVPELFFSELLDERL